MALAASKHERGQRVIAFQTAVFGEGDTNGEAVLALRLVAERYDIPVNWDASRLSKIRNGIQNLSLEDVASLVILAREKGSGGDFGDWFYFAFGAPTPKVHRGKERNTFPTTKAQRTDDKRSASR